MKLTIAGGGSTFTPGIIRMLLDRIDEFKLTEICLYDNDKERQEKIAIIVKVLIDKYSDGIKFNYTTSPKEAFTNTDIIFAQFRVGKYPMRELDEKIPLKHGVIGQETCGPGGLAYGLRTIFPMVELIDFCEEYANEKYWILNYSNPAAIVAEACRKLRPNARIINICDMPVGILENLAAIVGVEPSELDVDYYGLNHYGWFTSIKYNGEEQIPMLRNYIKEHGLINPAYLKYINGEDEKEIAPMILRHIKGGWYKTMTNQSYLVDLDDDKICNTYLQYYLIGDKILEQSNPEHTRANEVMEQREAVLFDGIEEYLKTGIVDENIFYAGAHGGFIVDVCLSILQDLGKPAIVMMVNNGVIPNMPDDAIIEVPARMTSNGPVADKREPIELFQQGMMQNQLACEKLIVEAAVENSYLKALQAFTLNKTVPSMFVAQKILDEMIEANKEYWPELR